MNKEIIAEGILSGWSKNKEKNVVSLTVKTDDISEEDLQTLKDMYKLGKGNVKPKAILKIIFDGKLHEILGVYKKAY